jgi:hypothetical protein
MVERLCAAQLSYQQGLGDKGQKEAFPAQMELVKLEKCGSGFGSSVRVADLGCDVFSASLRRKTDMGSDDKIKKKQEDGKNKQAEAPAKPAKRKIDDDDLDDIFSKPKKQEKKPEGGALQSCTCTMVFMNHAVQRGLCAWVRCYVTSISTVHDLIGYMLC